MAKVNDRFRMEEGYEVEYISQLIEKHQQELMSYFREVLAQK